MEHSRKLTLAYWIVTILFVLHYASGAVFDIVRPQIVVDTINHLGYPLYFLTLLSVAKLFAIIALLMPGYQRIREWAYAGITFNLLFASYSHFMSGDPVVSVLLPLIVLAFAITSYALWHKRENA